MGIKFKWGMRLYKATPITFLSSRKSRHVVWHRINVLELPTASNFRAKVQIFSVDGYMWCSLAAWHDPVPNITTSVLCTLCCNLQTQFCCVVSVYWVIQRGLQPACHNVLLFASLPQPFNANTYYSKPLHIENLKWREDLVAKNRLQLWGLEQVDIKAPKYS